MSEASEPFGIAAPSAPQTVATETAPLEPNSGPAYGMAEPSHEPAPNPQPSANETQPTTAQTNTASNNQPDGILNNPPDPENLPITDFGKFDPGLPEGTVNPDTWKSFGEVAVKHGLTPAQAKALANWQIEEIQKAQDALFETESKALQSAWGNEFAANRDKVNALCARISQTQGLENFSAELARSGAANNAVVVRGLLAVASMLAEDSAGKVNNQPPAVETAYDGLRDVYERARGLK